LVENHPRILVAGIGNVLRQDDGFGPAVIRELEESRLLPEGVRTVELGIGGINLVLELMDGYDALVLIDAVERGQPPGTLFVLDADVSTAENIPPLEAWGWSSDSCATLPSRALVMAQAAGALPKDIRIIGCQPGETDEISMVLSPAVQKAVIEAAETVLTYIQHLNGNCNG
jgi:hydrogenase maturation protease